MQKVDILIKNAFIVTMNKSREIISNGSIAITGDKIIAVGSNNSIQSQYFSNKIIDAWGKFIFPGFISTHTHLFQVLLKGLGRDKKLFDWLDSSVRRALCNIDEECCYYAALTGCIESIRSGTTTVLDYQYCHGKKGLDDFVMQAMDDIGIRGILGRGYTNTDGFPKEFALKNKDTEEQYITDTERLATKYKDHSRLSVAIAPGIIWDLSDEGFIQTRELAKKLQIPITMHLVETTDDDEYCIKAKGLRTVPYLEKMGILGPNFIAVHCVYMTDEDIALFKKYDVKVSHNPVSNMILASGIADVPKFLKEGITVSLACDGAASNDTQDMLEILKATALLHKVNTHNASVLPASKVLEMATLGGAKSVLMENKIGSIEAGKKADLFIYNPIDARSIPVHDPVSAIVYSSSQANVETSIIDGKIIMEKGKFININEKEILFKTQELASKLVKKSGLGNTQWGQKISIEALK